MGAANNSLPSPTPTSPSATASASPISAASAAPISTASPNGTPTASPLLSLTGAPAPLPSSSSFSPGPLAAGLFLALLALAALVMTRRRRRSTRLIEILESASLGPKRALVVARLGDELLVLGSSEGGIALLSTKPAAGLVTESRRSTAGERAAAPGEPSHLGRDSAADELRRELRRAGARPSPQDQEPSADGGGPLSRRAVGKVLDLFSRLGNRARSSAAPRFDTVLAESVEDVELRRKLAAGLAAQVGRSPSRSAP
jgi:flagellar protein FliO/FliZ